MTHAFLSADRVTSRFTRLLKAGLVAVWLMVTAVHALNAADRPNVVLIMTDDQGWGDLHCHGNDVIATPNLDQLASQSVTFDRFFVSPVCAPTRSSLLSGRYDVRTGVSGVTGRREVMRADEVTIAEILKSAGYVTGCFGKWHNGEQFPNHPTGQGFDHFFGFCGGHWNNYFNTTLEHRTPQDHNIRQVNTDGYITDVITDAAVQFIDDHSEGPFFCYVPYNAPHTPWQVPDEWFDRYSDKGLDVPTACAYAMVENIDHNTGRILQRLDDLQLRDNTIVLFLTDNGPNGKRYNGGMRGTKGSVHEGGCRVPLFVSWPRRLTAHKVPQIAAHIDLLPTIADLCEVSVPASVQLDGRSLVPLLKNDSSDQWTDRKLFTYRRTGSNSVRGAVRTQRFRFVREKTDQLYDMLADPGQKTNVSDRYPDVLAELSSSFDQFAADIQPSIRTVEPIPVGFDEAPVIQLPAVEAALKGNVRFANGQGYAHDWITNWSAVDDTMTWPIAVQQAGQYEVILQYACDSSATGQTVRLQASGHEITATVTDAYPSSITERPERALPRGARLMREFGSMMVGTVTLPAGLHDLQLSSPDPHSIDVGGLQLLRLP
jgi:arylsulfatase A